MSRASEDLMRVKQTSFLIFFNLNLHVGSVVYDAPMKYTEIGNVIHITR